MKNNILDNLNPENLLSIRQYIGSPKGNLLIYGPLATQKYIVDYISQEILNTNQESKKLQNILKISVAEKTSIGIEQIRQINSFLKLKSLNGSDIRLIEIQSAEKMTIEAQNSFLKISEDLPKKVHILTGTSNISMLLPTVLSRLNKLIITPFNLEDFTTKLKELSVNDNYRMLFSIYGGHISEYQLVHQSQTSTEIKSFIKLTTAQKLSEVNKISRSKKEFNVFLSNLVQISDYIYKEYLQSGQSHKAQLWLRICKSSIRAITELQHNANSKLVATKLVLDFNQ